MTKGKPSPQGDEILMALKRRGAKGLTVAELCRMTGCAKLSTRVGELKELGYAIVGVDEDKVVDGKVVRKNDHKRYYLGD